MKSEKDKLLTCRVHTRITQDKYDELTAILKQSYSIHSLSELLRYILDNKPFILKTYDATFDGIMEELARIHSELHAIGININQITRKFNLYPDFEHRIFLATEAAEQYKQTGIKVDELLYVVSKLSKRWLPE